MFKNLKPSNNCPHCRSKLEEWGEEDDYIKDERTTIYLCRACGFKKKKHEKLKNGSV